MAALIDRLMAFCGAALYALVALALRVIVARDVFIAGQAKITGPSIPIPNPFGGAAFTVTLPAEIKPSTFELFQKQYAALPMASDTAAYLYSYAEFVLPICLVLGFATRLSALLLVALLVIMQIYVAAALLGASHLYLLAILMVLVSVGPGGLSADAMLRALYRR
jgi:putative oxidoreductase